MNFVVETISANFATIRARVWGSANIRIGRVGRLHKWLEIEMNSILEGEMPKYNLLASIVVN